MADETKDAELKLTFADGSSYFNTGQPLKFTPTTWDCPNCGEVTSTLVVSFGNEPDLDGNYCQKCWVRWMKEFVPRVTRK